MSFLCSLVNSWLGEETYSELLLEFYFRRQSLHLQRLTLPKEDVPKLPMGFLGFLFHSLETGVLGNSGKIFLTQGESKEGSNPFHSQYLVLTKGIQHRGEIKRHRGCGKEPASGRKPSRGGRLPQCHQGILRALTETEPTHGGLSFKAFSSLPKATAPVPDTTLSMNRQGHPPPNPHRPPSNIKD